MPDNKSDYFDKQKIFEAVIIHELEAKITAVNAYDQIIWKLRAGYIAILYGVLYIYIAAHDKSGLANNRIVAGIAIMIVIIGFSCIICLLDAYFIKCKIRVVEALDLLNKELVLACKNGLAHESENNLAYLLKNAGETKRKIINKEWNSFVPLFVYPATVAIDMIAISVVFFM